MQELMNIEGVVHAHIVGKVEGKTYVFAGLGHVQAVLLRLRRGCAIFLGDMLAQVLALGGHIRVQFKWMPLDFIGGAAGLQRCCQLAVTDDAPRAHHIRDDVDVQCFCSRGCHR